MEKRNQNKFTFISIIFSIMLLCMLCGCESVYDKPIDETDLKNTILNECLGDLKDIPNCKEQGASFENDLEIVEVNYRDKKEDKERKAKVSFDIPYSCFNYVFKVYGNATITYGVEHNEWVVKDIESSYRFSPFVKGMDGLWVSYGNESFVYIDSVDWGTGEIVFSVNETGNKISTKLKGEVGQGDSFSDYSCINRITSDGDGYFKICEGYTDDGPQYYGDVYFEYNGVEYYRIDEAVDVLYDADYANNQVIFAVGNDQLGNATVIGATGYSISYSTKELVDSIQIDLDYDFTDVLKDYEGQYLTLYYQGEIAGQYLIEDIEPFMMIMATGHDGALNEDEFATMCNLLYYGGYYRE